jgi:hypothetical protein
MPDHTQRTELQYSQGLPLLAALAITGQLILLGSAWLLPLVSEYSLIGDEISELVLGRYGFVQTAAFVISGLGVLGLAFAIRQLTMGAWGSLIGSLLIGVYGAGAILVAIFPTDGIDDLVNLSTTGLIHVMVSLVSFLCVIVGMVVLSWTFGREARWRSLLPWAAIFATAAVSLIIAQSTAQQSPWFGLMQRALVTVIAAWLILVAIRARTITAAVEGG